MKTLLSILALLIAAPAWAVDPECVDATGEPPVFQGCQLKLTGLTVDLRFCAPQFDIDGDPIPEVDAIASCSVSLDAVTATVPVTSPGQLFHFTATGKNPGHEITAWCTTVEGLDGEVWSSDICFPAREPKKPVIKR